MVAVCHITCPKRQNGCLYSRPRPIRKRQPAIDLPCRVDVALTVFDDFGELAGSVVRVDFRAVETFLRRRNAEGFRKCVEARMLAAPLAPLLHGVVNRRVAETSKGKIARRFDPMDDRALIDEAKIEIEDVVADEEIA